LESTSSAQLLTIVEVLPEDKVLCTQPGCGHSVWKAIHVVREGAELLVLGSTCFEKRYGSGGAIGTPSYGGGSSRKLTQEERRLLVENTAAFMARIEDEERRRAIAHAEAQALANAQAMAHAQSTPHRAAWLNTAPPTHPRFSIGQALPTRVFKPCPWPWMKPGTSLGYFELADGSGWVRVLRNDGQQMLVPWPVTDGWDEALPAHIGTPNEELGGYVLFDVVKTVAYLRKVGTRDRVFDSWKKLHVETTNT